MLKQLPKALRTKDPDRLREVALIKRDEAAAAKAEAKELREVLAAPDWWGTFTAAGASVGGAVVSGAMRAQLGEKRRAAEPLLGVAVGVAGYWTDRPWLVQLGTGIGARYVSEWAEARTVEVVAAVRERRAERAEAEAEAEPARASKARVV